MTTRSPSMARLVFRGFGLVIALMLVPHVVAPAHADVVDEAWRRGNEAYFKNDYDGAVAALEQIDQQGVVSADLYYNLGNAYFRQGNLGRAIWSFERAAALEPEDNDAQFNLEQARKLAASRVHDKIQGADHDPLWVRVVTALPLSTETWLFIGLYLAVFLLLFLRRVSEGDRRTAWTASAAIMGALTVIAGALLFGRVLLDRIPFAIVLPDVVAVKEGADANYRTTFELHAGLRVRLLDRDQDWVRIRLANGLEGWLRRTDVGTL